jgi:hypothetical protein
MKIITMANIKNIVGLLIALLLLGYGLVRVGVGGALLAQSFNILDFAELSKAIAEVREFIEARSDKQIIPFTLGGYFTYIVTMGILLSIGSFGTLIRKKWGFVFLTIYILFHGALFINFKEINPKITVLVI